MNANGWSDVFGELARETMSSPELERYFSVPITKAARATHPAATFALRAPPARLLGLCLGQLAGAGGEAEDPRS